MLQLRTIGRALFIFATANFFFSCGINGEKKESSDAEDQMEADSLQPESDSSESKDKNSADQPDPKKELGKENGNDSDDAVTNDEGEDDTDDLAEAGDNEESSEEESSDLISQILPLLSGKGSGSGLNAGTLTSLLGGGSSSGGLGLGQITALLGAGNGTAGASSATNILSGLSNNQLKTLLGQLKP